MIAGRRAGEISSSVQAAIRARELKPGESLPPVRRLAEHLRVSPTTVAAAYRDLQLRGLVKSAGRRGTQVLARPALAAREEAPVPPGVRDLTTGNPDPRLLPDLRPSLRRMQARQWLYGERAADEGLLELAAERFAADGVTPDFLHVVGGALDGIERTLTANLRPGDRVGVEDPGYPAVFDLLLALSLAPEPLPTDDAGYLPEPLEGALRNLAAVIVTPRGQNPTGAALDAQRASELRQVLARHPEVLLVEDDHAGPVAGVGAHTLSGPPIERWAVVRSASKSLGPDLRVGVIAGDPVTISRVEARQKLAAGWVSHLLQAVVVDLAQDAGTRALVRRAKSAYADRRETLVRALAARGFEAHGRSGLNVWVPVSDEQAAVRRLLDAGWAVSAGARFRLRSGPAIRVSIGALDPAEAEPLAAALAAPVEPGARTRSA